MIGDPEIARLLLEEIRRHEPSLVDDADGEEQRRALHALKGSAGSAGERALWEALARIERRLIDGESDALTDARHVIARAREALETGKPFCAPPWPEPPWDLRGRPVEPTRRVRYVAEMSDRLARVDQLLAVELPEPDVAGSIFREVHAMKAAALAAGDEATAWFCHGLEERTREGQKSAEGARRAIEETERWRGVLGELVAAPERAVEMLRRIAVEPRPRSSSRLPPPAPVPSDPPPRTTSRPPISVSREFDLDAHLVGSRPPPSTSIQSASSHAEPEPRSAVFPDATLRVPTAALDRLLERVRTLEQAEAAVASAGRDLYGMATRARRIRSALAQALGTLDAPPSRAGAGTAAARLSDASTAMAELSDALDREAVALLGIVERARGEAAAAHADLSFMRTTTVAWLFDRVAAAASAHARREGRKVRIVVRGGETPIDRRVAEELFDPVLQLAQNAVVHGIEPETERASRGKPRDGRVELTAEQRGGMLVLRVSDDGAGVDVASVRARAVARGTISAARARSADAKTLLRLLFVPGFTTRDSADVLAGRGVGLGVVLEAVRRLGGTVRLSSRSGEGLTATLEVPVERGLVKVLWVRAGQATYALPARQVRRVLVGREIGGAEAFPLTTCIRGMRAFMMGEALGPADEPAFVLELEPGREDALPVLISADGVGEVEEASLRAVPPLVSAAGPYNGAIVRGDAVYLCLDVHALVELVQLVHGRRGPESIISAERAGFEPADQFPDPALSKRVP